MTSYWTFPELLPNPNSVESVKSMVKRSQSFLKELEKKNYENVLIVCHGGIIRSLCGYLEDRKMVLSGDQSQTIVRFVFMNPIMVSMHSLKHSSRRCIYRNISCYWPRGDGCLAFQGRGRLEKDSG